MNKLFYEGLTENNIDKLLLVPKSDIHNHSSKGCSKAWLEKKINKKLPKPPAKFDGVAGMHDWFTTTIKPHCRGKDGIILRWEGAFFEAKRNNIERLAMSFGVQDIELVGGMASFVSIITSFHNKYCPNTRFEPELTYASSCNILDEANNIDKYIEGGFFKSIDVCGGENVRPFEDFKPLYAKAEKYHLKKKMHVGESGTSSDVEEAVLILGLDEVHHGINASTSKEVMAFLVERNVQLNVCPTSNVMLGYACDYKNHPIRILVDNGVKVTINTDDLLILGSSIEKEYLWLYNNGVLTIDELEQIRLNGLGE